MLEKVVGSIGIVHAAGANGRFIQGTTCRIRCQRVIEDQHYFRSMGQRGRAGLETPRDCEIVATRWPTSRPAPVVAAAAAPGYCESKS